MHLDFGDIAGDHDSALDEAYIQKVSASALVRVPPRSVKPMPNSYQHTQIHSLPASTEKRVISYGLYGDNPKYTHGAIRNTELAPIYVPGMRAT